MNCDRNKEMLKAYTIEGIDHEVGRYVVDEFGERKSRRMDSEGASGKVIAANLDIRRQRIHINHKKDPNEHGESISIAYL